MFCAGTCWCYHGSLSDLEVMLNPVCINSHHSILPHHLTGRTGGTGCSVHAETHPAVNQAPCDPHTSLPMAPLPYHTAPQPRLKLRDPRVNPQPGISAALSSGYCVISGSSNPGNHECVLATPPSLGLDYSSSEEEEEEEKEKL